ncbi:MAG: Holliday junction resolvase YqgF [Dehalococcoidia bacterium]|nr:Holliday junction resolvase YqgF [Dehalococcoidia bacterium]
MEREAVRVLGLDVGERRIGVALSDPTGTIASPLAALQRGSLEADLRAVVRLVGEHGAEAIVVGIPLSLSGRVGPQARLVRQFLQALSRELTVPVHAQDERFSTVEAERLLRESGQEPSRNRGLTDSASAAVILQSYLESQRHP